MNILTFIEIDNYQRKLFIFTRLTLTVQIPKNLFYPGLWH